MATIRIEDFDERPKAELVLSNGTPLSLRRPSLRSSLEPSWAARRPGWGGARAAANRLLAASFASSAAGVSVAALSERDRQRLMLAVVGLLGAESRWRGLYGTSLTVDERFFAIIADARRREGAELLARLRDMRRSLATEVATSATPGIAKSLAGINSINRSLAGLGAFDHIMKASTASRRYGLMGLGVHDSAVSKVLKGGSAFGIADYKSSLSKLSFGAIPGFERGLGVAGSAQLTKAIQDIAIGAKFDALKLPFLRTAESPAIAQLMFPQGGLISESIAAGMPSLNSEISKVAAAGLRSSFGTLPALASLYGGRATEIANLKNFTGAGLFGGFDVTKIGIGTAGMLGGFAGQWRRSFEALILAEFARLWGDDPLWFLIRELSPLEVPELVGRDPAEVHEAVLDALEEILDSVPVLKAVEGALKEMPFLSEDQREWLAHGLEHARKREWRQAVPPLIVGFEGALYAAAIDAKAIAVKGGKLLPAEKIIKAIELGEAYEVFALRLVFGGPGNAFRHGRPETPAREQTLLAIVAIIGWIDSALDTRGTGRLAEEIRKPLARNLVVSEQRPELNPA